jgi:transcriptional regulator with XRE-family HTH domain
MELDRNKLRRNVLYYANLKGLKIGAMERSIGRRAGYIARWGRTETISVADVYKIANILDVTIDTLINEDVDLKVKQEEITKLKQQIDNLENQIKEIEVTKLKQIEDLENQIKEIEVTIK